MKRSTVSWILKAVLVVGALGILLAAAYMLPTYMKHVVAVMPELSGAYGWVVAYGWLLSIPALVCVALLWQVFGTIATNDAFCQKNALRFTRIWQLALFDLGLVVAMGIFLILNRAMPPFLILTVSTLLFLGVTAGATAFALAGLTGSAAEMAENDKMTI